MAYEFAILGEGGRFLGGCGINQISTANRFANLGYWGRTSAMGRGVAPAAARLVAGYAFRETELIGLEIVCAAANTRSQRVAGEVRSSTWGGFANRPKLS